MTEGRQKRLQLSNKILINTASNLHNFNITKNEKHCRRIYYEQNSRAKRRKSLLQGHWICSAFLRVSCNVESVLYKKNASYWDYYIPYMRYSWPFHWYASSLNLLLNIHAAGQRYWPLLSFLLLYWIAGIYSKPESNIENIKIWIPWNTAQSLFTPFPRNQLATNAPSFPRRPSNTASAMIIRHVQSAHRFHMKSRLRSKFPTPYTWGSNSPPPGRL